MDSPPSSLNPVFRLLKNTIFLFIAEITRPLISLFLIAYISRVLGADGVGQYGTILTFLFFFETFAMLGLENIIIRDIAASRAKKEKYLSASVWISVISTLVALIILFLLVNLIHYPEVVTSGIKILSLSLLFFILTGFINSFFEGLQRMEFKSCLAISETLLRVSLGLLAVSLGYGVLGLIWTLVAVRIIICLASFYLLVKQGIRLKFQTEWYLCFSLLKQTMIFLLISFISATYWRIDVLMLSKMKLMSDVGSYTVAYRLVDILKGLSYSYIAALFPMISSTFTFSKGSFEKHCLMSVRYLFILTFPISIGTSILAGKILVLIYGAEFIGSANCLRILIWTICFFPIALIFARALVASHNQRWDLGANILGMLFNIILNIILIPRLSYLGAAIATLGSICFFLGLQFVFVSRQLFKVTILEDLLKPFIAGCLMGIFTFWLRDLNLFIVISISALFYGITLFLIKTFSKEEIRMLREIWQNKYYLLTESG
jgi:O-antigen/teichoic acid export membrane protein